MKKGIIKSEIDFNHGFLKFFNGKPVKVDKKLKNNFLEFISSKMIQNNVFGWHSTIENLKTCAKFKRT